MQARFRVKQAGRQHRQARRELRLFAGQGAEQQGQEQRDFAGEATVAIGFAPVADQDQAAAKTQQQQEHGDSEAKSHGAEHGGQGMRAQASQGIGMLPLAHGADQQAQAQGGQQGRQVRLHLRHVGSSAPILPCPVKWPSRRRPDSA